MRKDTGRLALSLFLCLSLAFPALMLGSDTALADSWSDDFTDTGMNFNARWVEGGVGDCIPDGTTYALAYTFDDDLIDPATLPLWYGPTLRSEISLSGDFDVLATLNCIAETSDYNVGKMEVRLLDAYENIVYSFGWADTSNPDNKAFVYLRGEGGQQIFATEEGFIYSVFSDKDLGLKRNNGQIRFYIEGAEEYAGSASVGGIKFIELIFLKYNSDSVLVCTPDTMQIDFISVDSTPATVPDKPADVTGTSGDGYVNISWEPPADNGGVGISSYKIFRGSTSGATSYLTTVGNVGFFNNTGLTNGKDYFFAVSAVNEVGEGQKSNEISGSPKTIPAAPKNLLAIAGDGHVNLTWAPPASDGGADITGYSLCRGVQADSLSLVIYTGTQLYFSDFGLANDQMYYYVVSAENSVGEGGFSSIASALPGSVPSAPSEPRDIAAEPYESSIEISWAAPEFSGNLQITGYNLYRGTNPSGLVLLQTLGDVLSYTDVGLTNGQTYYYRVGAVNAIGESNASELASAAPFVLSVPSVPLNLSAVYVDGQIFISWERPGDDGGAAVLGYHLFRETGDNQTETVTLGDILAYTDTNISAGTEYFYKVSAVNSVGAGSFSGSVNVSVPAEVGGNTTDDVNIDETSGTWGLNSSIVTIIVFVIGGIGAVLYMRKAPEPESDAPESPEPETAETDVEELVADEK